MPTALPNPGTPDFPERFGRLTALEQAQALARGKRRHERQYPSTGHGGDRRSAAFRASDIERKNRRRAAPNPERQAFTDFAARLLDCTARSVQVTVQIAERIPPTLQAALAETRVAERKRDLVRIAGMSPERHRQLLECLEAGARPATLDALLGQIGRRKARQPL